MFALENFGTSLDKLSLKVVYARSKIILATTLR